MPTPWLPNKNYFQAWISPTSISISQAVKFRFFSLFSDIAIFAQTDIDIFKDIYTLININ